MTCLHIGNAIVCGDFGLGKHERKRLACPTCKRKTTFVRAHSTSEWYAPTDTCLSCGDSWSEGERHERPFAPRWRQRSIDAAKASLKRNASP